MKYLGDLNKLQLEALFKEHGNKLLMIPFSGLVFESMCARNIAGMTEAVNTIGGDKEAIEVVEYGLTPNNDMFVITRKMLNPVLRMRLRDYQITILWFSDYYDNGHDKPKGGK